MLVAREQPLLVERIDPPQGVVAILLHPNIMIETRMARSILADQVEMKVAVEHSRRLAVFIAGCANQDLDLVRAGFEDLLVEPQRRHLLPALGQVKAGALGAGALGCSFSGSGPSVFAWALEADAEAVEEAMTRAFVAAGIKATSYRAPIASAGVKLLGSDDELAAA